MFLLFSSKLRHAGSPQKDELHTGEMHFIDADAATMSRYYGPYFALFSNSSNLSPTGEFMNGYESSCASFKLNAIMKDVCEQDATLLDFRNVRTLLLRCVFIHDSGNIHVIFLQEHEIFDFSFLSSFSWCRG